jgi:hypothetical protein
VELLRQQPTVVLIPGPLKNLRRIVPPLEREKFTHPRIAGLDLIAPTVGIAGGITAVATKARRLIRFDRDRPFMAALS